jgi:hypothetical protein
MNSKDFIIWLKGFTEGVHQYNITPVQWETLKEKLAQVDDNTIPMGGVIVDHNTFKINDQGFHQMPSHRYGTTSTPNFAVTTGSTGTAVGYSFPGTTVHYTTNSGSAFSYTNTTNDKTLLHD